MYATDIKKLAKQNDFFRRVLHTGAHAQLVAMSLEPDQNIGLEVHLASDQLLFFVEGKGEVVVDGDVIKVEEHDAIFVPAGAWHNVSNGGHRALKLFTVYAPAAHADGLIDRVKPQETAEV